MAEIKEVNRQTAKVKKAPRFDEREWKGIADYIVDEFHRRKDLRKDLDRYWKEIDRQIAMEPNTQLKKLPDGSIDAQKRWMSETELPLQAQALEVLTAD